MVNSMWKNVVLSIIVTCMFFCLPVETVFANDYIDYSDQHTYPNETLEQIVEVYAYDENYNKDEAQAMINRIGEIPEIILQAALGQDVRLLFVDFPITDMEEFADLQGEQPRGHNEDAVWDNTPGAGGQITIVRIGHSKPGSSHGAANLEYHEFGHAIEYALYDSNIMADETFMNIHAKEKENLFPQAEYMDYVGEYFAEVIAYYYVGGEKAKELQQKAPETYAFIKHLPDSLLIVEENSSDGIVLRWSEMEDAHSYEISRDGEILDQIEETTYTDLRFDSFGVHHYDVQALDENGNLIHETISREISAKENGVVILDENDVVKVDKVAGTTVELSWNDAENASYYEIYRDDELLEKVYLTSYQDTKLETDTTYMYEVKAFSMLDNPASFPEVRVHTLEKASIISNPVVLFSFIGIGICICFVLLGSFIFITRRKRRQ